MALLFRKGNTIYTNNKKTIHSTHDSINAAKRISRQVQKAGDSVFVIPRKGGRK